jgi:tetratricopeptide (TPR) repeat protein
VPACAAQTKNSAAVKAELAKAQAALEARRSADAQQLFQAVLKLDPGNVEAEANLGVMAFFHGDCAGAEPYFRGAIKGDAALTKMKALLSVCEMKLGQARAQADMESAYKELHDAKLKARLGIELANLYYERGDLERTARVLQQLLDMQPDNVDFLFFAQRVYSELANGTLNKLAVLAPGSARMEQLIAERLINDGDLKDATTHYEKALRLDPRLPGVHFELAEALMQAGGNDAVSQAKAELEQAIQIDGDSANVESELGRIALLQSHGDKALADYRRAYRMNPASSTAALGIAAILEQRGENEQALGYLRTAVKEDPFSTKANYRLFLLYKKMHLEDAARKQLKLFVDVRATKSEVENVYHAMHPAGPSS